MFSMVIGICCRFLFKSDLVLSKPSHTIRQESQSVSKLSFQRADEPNNVLTADGKLPVNDQTSLDVHQR